MNFKKGNPGCPCDCSEQDCQDRCLIPCTGSESFTDCNFCEIDIQLPQPDITGIDPLLLPPEQCADEARCWACYQVFDLRLLFSDSVNNGDCEDWTLGWYTPRVFDTAGPYSLLPRDGKNWEVFPCWSAANYSCPYDNSDTTPCPDSNILIGPVQPFSPSLAAQTQGRYFQLSGNEWDGSCGKLILKIAYTVIESVPGFVSTPIDPDNPECNDYKWTAYVHTFELEYCTCESVLLPFTFVSTQSEDSCAGGVADVCRLDEATIVIQKNDESSNCSTCVCLNCSGYKSTEVQVTISGPTINGTFILTGGAYCFFAFGDPNGIGGCTEMPSLSVIIRCLACDQFRAEFYGEASGQGGVVAFGFTNVFPCDGTGTVENLSGDICGIASHTVQVSFVPA